VARQEARHHSLFNWRYSERLPLASFASSFCFSSNSNSKVDFSGRQPPTSQSLLTAFISVLTTIFSTAPTRPSRRLVEPSNRFDYSIRDHVGKCSFDEASGGKESTQNAIPRKRMTSRHTVAVPSNVRVFENRCAGQNRWVIENRSAGQNRWFIARIKNYRVDGTAAVRNRASSAWSL
jgi:hypothetical protein